MKNKLTRKLMLSAFTLLFAVISLGASTYAWFVLSENAKVTAFQGTVTSGTSGLEIAITDTSITDPAQIPDSAWKATELNIKDDLESIFTEFDFDAVQNSNPLNSSVFTDINDKPVSANGKNGDYLQFKLWFRLADTNDSTVTEYVYLNDYTMDTVGDVEPWFVNKSYTKVGNLEGELATQKQGTSATYYVSDAARITFTDCTNELYLETPTLKGGEGYKSEGKQLNGALSYFNAIQDTTGRKSLPENYENPTYKESSAYEGKTAVVELKANEEAAKNYVGSTIVTIWIDGWDGECINAIFGQTLEVSFTFSLNPKHTHDFTNGDCSCGEKAPIAG